METKMDSKLCPPFRFGAIEPSLFRSAHPTPLSFPFLKSLRLKSILCLTSKVHPELQTFAANNNINVLHIRVEQAFDNITLTHEHVALFLEIVINMNNHPCLFHCYDGGDTTGLAVRCLRKLQMVSVLYNAAEFERYRRAGAGNSPEMNWFVDSFKHPVKLPPTLPVWLWGGDSTFKHPSIPIRLDLTDNEDNDTASVTSGGGGGGGRRDQPLSGRSRVATDAYLLLDVVNKSEKLQALSLAGTF